MRTVDSIRQSFSRFGYSHLRKDQHTLEQAQMLAAESGGKLTGTSNYHFTLEPEGAVVNGTDWEELRRQEKQRKLKLAERRKRLEQNEK